MCVNDFLTWWRDTRQHTWNLLVELTCKQERQTTDLPPLHLTVREFVPINTFSLFPSPSLSSLSNINRKKLSKEIAKYIYKKPHFFTTIDSKRTIKMSLTVLYAGWGHMACYSMTFAGLYISSSPLAVATGRVVSKTKHSKTKTKARSTQISKTKPVCPLKTQDSPLSSHQQQESCTITNRMQFKTIQPELRGVANAFPTPRLLAISELR